MGSRSLENNKERVIRILFGIMKKVNITNFFDNQYLDYSKYVVKDRAIPSVIDGFKPVHRKIINEAIHYWSNNSVKPLKVFQLGGRVASNQYYHHGDASLYGAIITMAQKFKNSLPLLDSIGQFGTLRSPSAGAPRYVSTKLTPYFNLLYKDSELLTAKIDEGVEIEPEYFLPIIPTIIINGSSGIAVGFSTNILNRNPYDVIDACICVLEGKKQKILKPYLAEFKGEWTQNEENSKSWTIKGVYEIVNTSTVHISELPPNHTYESYEKLLDKLEEKGMIASYDDNSSDKIDYTLKFQRATLKELIEKEKLENVLGLIGHETENLTTIDENQNVKVFDSVNEIVEYFVNFRLKFYQKRKDYLINKLETEMSVLSNKAKFIKAIIDNKLKVKNVPKTEVEEWLSKNKFDKINNSFNYLLQMQIYSLTKEKYEELLKETELKKAEIENIKKLVPKQMYLDDLNELKKELKKLKI